MTDGLIELFEDIKNRYYNLSVLEFTDAIHKYQRIHFNFLSVVQNTSLLPVWAEFQQYLNTIINDNLPTKLREGALQKFRSRIDEVLIQLQTGAVEVQKRRISEGIINKITSPKIKQLCIEINNTPDQNTLSLSQNIGEALKWALWHKAKQMNTSLKETGNLGPLLDEAISKSYFQSNAARRFLNDFKNNFMKTGYDMVRHSESYVPDIQFINPQIHALEIILEESFA